MGSEMCIRDRERFVYFDRYQSELFKNDPRDRIVILAQVLPSPCTVGYEEVNGIVVTEVNGVKLKSLADMDAAVAHPIDGFHRIEFADQPKELVLDAKQTAELEPLIIKNYHLPAIKRVD